MSYLLRVKELRAVPGDELEFCISDGGVFLMTSYLLRVKELRAVPGDELEFRVADGGVFLGTVPGEEEPGEGEDETDDTEEIEDEGPTVLQGYLAEECRDQEGKNAAYTIP